MCHNLGYALNKTSIKYFWPIMYFDPHVNQVIEITAAKVNLVN